MRMRQHINPLGLSFQTYRDAIPELDPGRPVEVEIGCAEAQFLFERAEVRPDAQLFGLEIRDWMVRKVNRWAKQRQTPVTALECNANLHLRTVFADQSVDIVHVLFPDPWFKKRQRKRRLVDTELTGAIHSILKPGGELHFASDVWTLALDALAVFEGADELFENRAGAWSFWKDGNPYQARSWREANCDAEGMKIWRMIYRRR
ncbi:MAG: hypothetical protein KJO07_14630 [Deltaproteobacteria bacterium]|nr:hypothetical protein [Deltaproteobacteria bacterium]